MCAKKISSIIIAPGCISCGTCQALCSEVFKIEGIATVRPGADVDKNAECIREAADICPVCVIELVEE